jgi:nicotinate-nucleotide--dimethylbenzimidazole phosphoribosyltransferase
MNPEGVQHELNELKKQHMNSIDLQNALQNKINLKTKPLGSLGQLEEIALQLGMIQQTLNPSITHPAMLVFAADHGLTDEKISPYPKEVTWQMVMNFVQGGAAINVFCRMNGIHIQVVNAGVDYDFPSELPIVNASVGKGTANMLHAPAMTMDQCHEAMEKGAQQVRLLAQKGCNTIGFGEMGIGNTSASALLMHRFLNLPIEECCGAGAGMQGEAMQHKKEVLKAVSLKHNPSTPLATLACFGGFEIAMMSGAVLEAARQRMVILVDGFIATAAILTAYQLDNSVKDHCIFCHESDENGHRKILSFFHARPVLKLGMRLGEGTGAALALPVIKAAAAFLNEMASFEDAQVSNKEA